MEVNGKSYLWMASLPHERIHLLLINNWKKEITKLTLILFVLIVVLIVYQYFDNYQINAIMASSQICQKLTNNSQFQYL
uniref:Uncharacterized protein n=1 Tax=Octopus bimaculoides TaxID=37653 RepID=A0A0L8GN36_OCTBM